MKFFDSIINGQLDQVSNNSRPSNDISDDNELDLQQILIEEACQCWLNQIRLIKLKKSQIEIQTQI